MRSRRPHDFFKILSTVHSTAAPPRIRRGAQHALPGDLRPKGPRGAAFLGRADASGAACAPGFLQFNVSSAAAAPSPSTWRPLPASERPSRPWRGGRGDNPKGEPKK